MLLIFPCFSRVGSASISTVCPVISYRAVEASLRISSSVSRKANLNASVEQVSNLFETKRIRTQLQNGSVLSMPYEENFFDTVLLISILEHLKPSELLRAFEEIRRVLKPNGQVVYGVPIERPFMVFMFRLLGYNIREHHFSTEKDVLDAAGSVLGKVRVVRMKSVPSIFGAVYEVGHFKK